MRLEHLVGGRRQRREAVRSLLDESAASTHHRARDALATADAMRPLRVCHDEKQKSSQGSRPSDIVEPGASAGLDVRRGVR